jgi:hypothetical protein
LALVLSAAIKGYDLNRGLETEQSLKTGEKSLEEGSEKIGA